jgi:hypothetical protein
MNKNVVASLVVVLSLALTAGTAKAASVHEPLGLLEKATSVPERLALLERAVALLSVQVVAANVRIAALQSQLSTATDTIARLRQNSVLALDGRLTLATTSNGSPAALFTGVNVQLVNGSGQTYGAPNGVGNLLIGYDTIRTPDQPVYECSIGPTVSVLGDRPATCEADGGTWAISHKSGSHNLVVGDWHNYSQTGSVVFGWWNTVNQVATSVSGGTNNAASEYAASVTGGYRNTASGATASVSGGYANAAKQTADSVSGGLANIASGGWSSVSGGEQNTASGATASVSGGLANIASGGASSVSGGNSNTASGHFGSSVSGGWDNKASGFGSSVSGGRERTATGETQWVAGGLSQPQ